MFSNKHVNYMKLRTNLRLSINRLKLLEKKKTELALKARKEIADYISSNKDDRARIRVEHIVREDYLVEAMEIIEMFCDLLLARFGLIEKMKELDPGLEESIATILWVTPRLSSDVPELKEVSSQLTNKYGKEYAELCRKNGFENVNEKVLYKMSLHAPPKLLIENYMIEIAKAFNVPFVPDLAVMEGESEKDNIANDLIDVTNETTEHKNGKSGPPPDLMGGNSSGKGPPPSGGSPGFFGGGVGGGASGGGSSGYFGGGAGAGGAGSWGGTNAGPLDFNMDPTSPAALPSPLINLNDASPQINISSPQPPLPLDARYLADRPPPPLPSRPPNSNSPSPNRTSTGVNKAGGEDDVYCYAEAGGIRGGLWPDDPPPYDNFSAADDATYVDSDARNGAATRSTGDIYVPVHPNAPALPTVPQDQIQSGKHNTEYSSGDTSTNQAHGPGNSNIYMPVLPDLPAVPSDSVRTEAPDDVDFDDLTRRFEALKKK